MTEFKRTVSAELEIEVPMVPDFLKIIGTDATFPISEFSEETLRKIGESWTERLIERAEEQKS